MNSAPDDLAHQLAAAGFRELPIRVEHTRALRRLPSLHRDPFDRILVAQATVERLAVLTRDPLIVAYPVRTLAA